MEGYGCAIASFRHQDLTIAYTEYGSGGRSVVLVHGLLLSQRMHERLARELEQRGNHVVTIDLLGHGRSDRPAGARVLLDAAVRRAGRRAAGVCAAGRAARVARCRSGRTSRWTRCARTPAPSGAVLQGLFFGRVAPAPAQRRAIVAPTLVVGHRRDPLHPLSDADVLADELPNGRLLEANSFVELRLTPDRLTGQIAAFLDECWKPAGRSGRARRVATAS